MNYLLVAATALEIEPFLERYRNEHELFHRSDTVDVLITGIGLTATTYSLTRQILLKRPGCVIQAGVGGGLDTKMDLGAVVVVKQDTLADQSVIELKKLKTLFDLKLLPQDQFPFKKGWLVNPNTELMKRTTLKQVKGISVNEITTSQERINFYMETFGATVESMEGAALHYVCLMENIPFVQVRSISNYIGERNKKKWNMKESVINLNNELLRILTNTY